MSKKVFVGMSGGVDSSVAAALLVEQGYDVVGVYMKNWSQDLPGMPCTWQADYQDAKRVAVRLGIELRVYDFQKDYRHKVVDYMIAEYQAGRTPNPDIMCNQEVKFRLFLDSALEDGADFIATGHYAQVGNRDRETKVDEAAESPRAFIHPASTYFLATAQDGNKDQTYFLYRITEGALSRTLFPIGHLIKPEVRQLALQMGLPTANKSDSQGICFVGKIGIKDFLTHELGPQLPGSIINSSGQAIGEHEGAIYYTIGQRHGLQVGGGLPYYVYAKSMAKNEVYVTTNLNALELWSNRLVLQDTHWITRKPIIEKPYGARSRHRATISPCTLNLNQGVWEVKFDQKYRSPAPGQSVVIYDGDEVFGGGVISQAL